MRSVLISAAAALALAGCASLRPSPQEHAAHHPERQQQQQRMGAQADQQMMMMQEMHQKMMSAGTPAERQALMAEHMKAMQGGMSMMCEMGRMAGTPGAGPMPAMPASGPQQEMMQRCMSMRDMAMQMMMERQPPASSK